MNIRKLNEKLSMYLDEQKINEATQIFKVHDDEWEGIMGTEQVKEFAIEQISDEFKTIEDEELLDRINIYIDSSKQDEIRTVLKRIFDNPDTVDLTIEQAKEILVLRMFDVDEINVY